jgi:hypothetical protein
VPRLRLGLRAALPSALAVVLLLGGCTGTSDPTSPVQAGAEGTYFHATFTLLDTATPCLPGVVCEPEFLDCDGNSGFTLPFSWTMDADEATAGVIGYNPSSGGSDARGIVIVRGTDTVRDTALSVAVNFTIDNATGAVTGSPSTNSPAIFANVDTRCTRINGNRDYVTLFGVVTSEPMTATIDALGVAGGEAVFATPDGAGLTPDYVQGTFSFTGQNQQQFGRAYTGRILVQGCFRVQMPRAEQGVALDPSATPGC